MIHIIRTTLFVIGIVCIASLIIGAQDIKGSKGWKIVTYCGMSFSVPGTLEDKKLQGMDSCVATLTDKRMILTLDYGWFSGVSKHASFIEYDERVIAIDEKNGTIATYRDPRNKSGHTWVARIFVVVQPSIKGSPEVAMNMFVEVKNKMEFPIAEQIFRSIKFNKK